MRKRPGKHDILCVKCRHWEGETKLSDYDWGDGCDVLSKCYVLGGFISAPNEHCFNFFEVRRAEAATTTELQAIRDRIFNNVKPEDKQYFQEQDAFCSPATFWGLALSKGLCSKEEFEQARQHYGRLWNYVGD